MIEETEMVRSTALALPDETQFRRDIQAINRFQQVVHSTMVKDLDYGVIPGTQKPTLLKPGAEKIAKLLGLADQYEIVNQSEDWHAPFFRYLVKCKLVHVNSGAVISEGMGECNSMESKYRWRWVGERDLPAGIDKDSLVSQERKSYKTGGKWLVYRIDNDDIYSQVNTILKMAKKRALVDAALSAGRLSDVFTQDMEDLKFEPEFNAEKPTQRARTETEAPKPDAPQTDMITDAQRKKIFASAKQMWGVGADEVKDTLKQIITKEYGVDSSKDLNKEQASDLIERIEGGESFGQRLTHSISL